MGIQGLAPFIRQKAPQCIRDVKLAALWGQTVAIDGQILTLKFHHSNESQHPNRTILSWYRFIRNLQSYSIKPIVVFDGIKRIPAKQRELERRYNARKLLSGRAESEEARFARLRQLKEYTETLRALPTPERSQVLQETHRLLQSGTLLEEMTSFTVSDQPDVEVEDIEAEPLGEAILDKQYSPPEVQEEQAFENTQAATNKIVEAIFRDDELVKGDLETPLSDPDLSRRFASLVLDTQAMKVAEESMLSKRQLAIAQSEAEAFTRALADQAESESESDEEEIDGLDALQLVLDESRCVADTYARRSIGVSKQTNTDCMEIIRAMGVPVIITSQSEPQEAESLCSSLVAASHADMVLSEDSDVLAFEAPLLRKLGVLSREGEHIVGSEVRKALGFATKEMWIDFCLLCGSDFTDRIKGFGPVKAREAILEYGTIEAILESGLLYKKKTITAPLDLEAYLDEIQAARAVFLSPVCVKQYTPEDFRMQAEDAALQDTLRSFGLDPDWETKGRFDAGFSNYGDFPNELESFTFDDDFQTQR